MTSDPFEQFRALLIAQPELANALSSIEDNGQFVTQASSVAAEHGLAIPIDRILAAIRPDPLGIARWTDAPERIAQWPAKEWLPVNVVTSDGEIFVDWLHFGHVALAEPFYEDSVRRAFRRPLNRLIRLRMTLSDFVSGSNAETALSPDGFVFHMSRCGSTLVAQMLAASPQNLVVSEPQPLDAMVQLARTWTALPADRHERHLQAMVRALGRARLGSEKRYFVKLDSWHTLALPLYRRAFPDVPWIFLYRDPVEVLVSHRRQPGSQMVPQFVPPAFYGLETLEGTEYAEYEARVLDKICGAVVDNLGLGGGRLINYRELPGAIRTKILPHFGVAPSDREFPAMDAAAGRYAKEPGQPFSPDSAEKQVAASDAVRSAASRHLAQVYGRLETLRAGAAPM